MSRGWEGWLAPALGQVSGCDSQRVVSVDYCLLSAVYYSLPFTIYCSLHSRFTIYGFLPNCPSDLRPLTSVLRPISDLQRTYCKQARTLRWHVIYELPSSKSHQRFISLNQNLFRTNCLHDHRKGGLHTFPHCLPGRRPGSGVLLDDHSGNRSDGIYRPDPCAQNRLSRHLGP